MAGETRRRRGLAPLKVLIIGTACLLALFHVAWQNTRSVPPSYRLCDPPKQGFHYPGEKIAWQACGELKNRTLECSNLTVPMDHFNATNSGNKTFTIPLIRLRGRNAIKNVLFNPGGPGGSGVGAVYEEGHHLHDLIGEGFHLLSFDPRGINGSRPTAAYYLRGAQEQMLRHANAMIHGGARPEDLGELVAGASNYVKACADSLGEHGGYINTPQTAADMNSILDAVGQDDMLYYGVSYGTVLGQTYAAMYPERSRRVIIDGVVNVFQWYSELTFSESLSDSQVIFESFLEECVKAGSKNCTLAAAAPDAPQIKARVMDLVERLRVAPLSVYLNATQYGLITTETVLQSAIFTALYRPSAWPQIADGLSQLLAGNGTSFLLDYGLKEAPDMTAFNFVMGNDGQSGPDYWAQGADEMQRVLSPSWNLSLVGTAQNPWYLPKQQWSIPKTHNFSVERPGVDGQAKVKTAHPILILSTTYDPVTPLRSAQAANSAFEGSQIVEVKGFGHSTMAEPSRCLVRRFRDYLYEGKLPDGHVTCEVDLPYFPRNDHRDDIRAAILQMEDDHEKAFAAQMALAERWPGPRL